MCACYVRDLELPSPAGEFLQFLQSLIQQDKPFDDIDALLNAVAIHKRQGRDNYPVLLFDEKIMLPFSVQYDQGSGRVRSIRILGSHGEHLRMVKCCQMSLVIEQCVTHLPRCRSEVPVQCIQ